MFYSINSIKVTIVIWKRIVELLHHTCTIINDRSFKMWMWKQQNYNHTRKNIGELFITEAIWVKISQMPLSSIGFTKLKRFKVDLKVEKQTLSYIVYGSINC